MPNAVAITAPEPPLRSIAIAERGDHVFETRQTIARPRAEVFAFFAEPANLERITPPWLRFQIVERDPGPVRAGSRFGYALRLHGLPLRWRSRIADWVPGERFVDIQVSGPYAKWHHLHRFEDADDGRATRIRDRVVYRLPLGRLGRLMAGRYVRSDVARIFSYRAARTRALLEGDTQ